MKTWRCISPGAGFTAAQQLCESVQQWHTDGSQQSFKAGLHEFTESLHQTALTTVHFILRSHHVRDERVVSGTRLEKDTDDTDVSSRELEKSSNKKQANERLFSKYTNNVFQMVYSNITKAKNEQSRFGTT